MTEDDVFNQVYPDQKIFDEAPAEVRAILYTFDFDADAYKECDRLLNELAPYKYSFDYGLDGEPFNLKKI